MILQLAFSSRNFELFKVVDPLLAVNVPLALLYYTVISAILCDGYGKDTSVSYLAASDTE